MKTKWFWLPLMAVFFGIMCSGCGDDNDPTEELDGGDNTEVKGDFTATAEVKTVKIPSISNLRDCVIYESFNHKHILDLYDGKLRFLAYYRSEGDWYISDYYTYHCSHVNMKDIGKVNGLSDITEKISLKSGYRNDFPEVQPNHGYAITFIKEEDEVGYLRVYVKSYTLDDNGSLSSITVQYQLY